jgi:hypothetical protein
MLHVPCATGVIFLHARDVALKVSAAIPVRRSKFYCLRSSFAVCTRPTRADEHGGHADGEEGAVAAEVGPGRSLLTEVPDDRRDHDIQHADDHRPLHAECFCHVSTRVKDENRGYLGKARLEIDAELIDHLNEALSVRMESRIEIKHRRVS